MDNIYTFDTETWSDGESAWVWSWALCNTELQTIHGNGVNMLQALTSLPHGSTVWVHNLEFDGEFVYWQLVRAGYSLLYDLYPRDRYHGVFDVLSDLNGIISIAIWTEGRRVILRDSFRLFRCRLEKLPKTCGFDNILVKGTMDYTTRRDPDHVATPDELAYQLADVKVLMLAMKWLQSQGAKGNTIGAVAVSEFKRSLDGVAPFVGLDLETRQQLRSLYNGGVVHGTRWGSRIKGPGRTYDRNSMYPAEAVKPLPVELLGIAHGYEPGEGKAYHVQARGLTLTRRGFPLLITAFTRQGRTSIPVLDKWLFNDEYEAVRRYYDGSDWHVVSTASFRYETVCTKFVNKWYKVKSEQPERRSYAKYILNNITGKFGENAIHEQLRRFVLDDGDYYNYRYNEIDSGVNNWRFMPAVAYITSCSRLALAEAAEKSGIENLLYTDTDSVHTSGFLPADMIDGKALGAWKVENEFDTAYYVKPKSYAEQLNGQTTACKHAGVNDTATLAKRDKSGKLYDSGIPISADNLKVGAIYYTNQARKVKGGVCIERKPKQM